MDIQTTKKAADKRAALQKEFQTAVIVAKNKGFNL